MAALESAGLAVEVSFIPNGFSILSLIAAEYDVPVARSTTAPRRENAMFEYVGRLLGLNTIRAFRAELTKSIT